MSLVDFDVPELGSAAAVEADLDRLAGRMRTAAAASPQIDLVMSPRYALHLALHLARRLEDAQNWRDATALLDRIEAAADALARRQRSLRADLVGMVCLSAVLGVAISAVLS